MIMEWKKQLDGTYHAAWRGVQFVLFDNPRIRRWQIMADEHLVKPNFSGAKRAMEFVDSTQQKIILKAAREYAAKQKAVGGAPLALSA